MEAFKQFSLNFTQMFLSSSSFHFVSTQLCPDTFEWFSLNFIQMFIFTVGLCGEPIIHYAGSKSRWHFNVMGFTLQFRVWSILLLTITCWTLWTFLNKLHPNVLSVTVCRVHDSDTPIQLQDQGHTSRSCSNIPLNFVSAPHISWTIWMIYIKLHSNFSETVCRTHDSVMQTQGHCHILM